MKKKISIKRMTTIAIFSALSILFYTIIPKISLPIFPPFLELNFSMVPIVICSFMLGPIDGAICVLVRFFVKLPMTITMCVGETADLLIGLPVAIVCGVIYNNTKWKHKEIIAFSGAFLSWIILSVITNAFINIPFYSWMLKESGGMDALIFVTWEAFYTISGGRVIVNEDNFMFYYLTLSVIPFNTLLSMVVLLITWPVHKRLKVLYSQIGNKNTE